MIVNGHVIHVFQLLNAYHVYLMPDTYTDMNVLNHAQMDFGIMKKPSVKDVMKPV